MKRILAGLLSILLIFSLFPQYVSASEETDLFAPLTVGGVELDPDTSDETSGWSNGEGWKYYAGKYLYLYNCNLSASEIAVNGRDLTIFAEGVNQIGTLSSDKSMSIFGNGVVTADKLNMYSTSLKLDSSSAPALFVKSSDGSYKLMNSSSAPGKILGTHTLPDGKTYVIPANTELQICMNGEKGASLTIPSGAKLQVGGKLSLDGKIVAESQMEFDPFGGGVGITTMDVPHHSILKVEGALSILSGASVSLSGTIALYGSMSCSATINAAAKADVPGRVTVNGNRSGSGIAISGGIVELKDGCSLGSVTSAGNTVVRQPRSGSATVGTLSLPNGGKMDVQGYFCSQQDIKDRGTSSLYITGQLTGNNATFALTDGIVYLSNAPTGKVNLNSYCVLLQDTDEATGNVTTTDRAKWYVRGKTSPATPGSVPLEITSLWTTTPTPASYDFESTLFNGQYAVTEGFIDNLVKTQNGSFDNSLVIVVGFDSSGKLLAVSYPKADTTVFRSVVAALARVDQRLNGGSGGSTSSNVTTDTGGSTLGGSDQGNSSSSGTETSVDTGSTYSFRIVASAGEGGSISPSGSVYVDSGSSQSFTITPSTGWELDGLKVNGSSVSAAGSYTMSDVSANGTIRATFKKQVLKITKTVSGSGTISGDATAEYGSSKTYTFTPDANWEVKDVQINGKSVGAQSSYTISSVTKNTTVAVTFQKKSFKITYSSCTGGSVSGPASVAYGESGTFTATPQAGWEVTDLVVGGTSYGAKTSTSATITGATTVSATFKKSTYKLTYNSPTGGSVTGPATATYGDSVTVTATPSEGWEISDLTIGSKSYGAKTSATATITGATSISATFKKKTYTVTIASATGGSVTGPTSVAHGESATYTAKPQEGWEVTDITIGGTSYGAKTSASATITGPTKVSATFKKSTYKLTINTPTGGTITGPTSAIYGDKVTFTATPLEGWELTDLTIGGTSYGTKATVQVTVSGNMTVSATFKKKTYTVTIGTATGGTVTGPTSVTHGESATYTATPQEGWEVTDITIGGKSYGAKTSATATITGATKVSATFKKKTYSVTLPTVTGGTVTGPTSVEYGASATYKLTVKDGYQISTFLVNDTDGSSGSATITVKGPVSITAEVALKTYTISKKAGEGGKITGSTTVKHFSTPSYTIEPNEGYEIADVKVDGVSVGAVEKYQFTSIKAKHTIAAEFRKITYTITATAGQEGIIFPEGRSTAESGSSLTYSMRANEGYVIRMVTVDGEEVGDVSAYTFENITGNHTISVTFVSPAALAAAEAAADEEAAAEEEEEFEEPGESVLISIFCGEGGTITPEEDLLLNYGEDCWIKIKADKGYVVEDVLIDGESVGAVLEYKLVGVTEDHTVEAVFAEKKEAGISLWVLLSIALLVVGAGLAVTVLVKKRKEY